jgi:hypothetical protein
VSQLQSTQGTALSTHAAAAAAAVDIIMSCHAAALSLNCHVCAVAAAAAAAARRTVPHSADGGSGSWGPVFSWQVGVAFDSASRLLQRARIRAFQQNEFLVLGR